MQAFVVRVTMPASFDALESQVASATSRDQPFGKSDIELVATESSVDWTVPRHVMHGDVILFQLSANTRARAKRHLKQLRSSGSLHYLGMKYACDLAEKYAGSIISIGRVSGTAYADKGGPHFRSRNYAEILDLAQVLVAVIGRDPFSQWPEFQPHGPVAYRQFTSNNRYRTLLSSLDDTGDAVPNWATREEVTVSDNVKVSRETWMDLARGSEFGFALEDAVRYYYADWLLRDLSDRRILYSEVTVSVKGEHAHWVDNVILVNGVPVPVEVKVNAAATQHLFDQLDTYRHSDELTANGKKLPDRGHDIVLVVDQEGLYLTDSSASVLPAPLLRRKDSTPEAIADLRRKIETRLVSDRS